MKRLFFLVVFIFILKSITCQNVIDFNIECNNYNTLYYGRTNIITINYDTTKYRGKIICEFDTLFKNISHKYDNQYSFFINDFEALNESDPRCYKSIVCYYKENDTIIKLRPKRVLLIDTNTWIPNLICDKYFVKDNIVYKNKFLSHLLYETEKEPLMIYFVRNDKIISNYKQVDYCISGFFNPGDEYVKICTINSKNQVHEGDLILFLKFLSDREAIYIENIEVIDSQGKKRLFPPMSFKYYYY